LLKRTTTKGLPFGKLRRPEEALKAFDKAIELDPKFAQAYQGKGLSLRELERHEEADKAFKRAKELGFE
jgi:tetratricopeptide (TPR) repeat protein